MFTDNTVIFCHFFICVINYEITYCKNTIYN